MRKDILYKFKILGGSSLKVNLNCMVLEKVEKEFNGNYKKALRIHQKGDKLNYDVTVSKDTFDSVSEGEVIELQDITVGLYRNDRNGQTSMYCKEDAA